MIQYANLYFGKINAPPRRNVTINRMVKLARTFHDAGLKAAKDSSTDRVFLTSSSYVLALSTRLPSSWTGNQISGWEKLFVLFLEGWREEIWSG